MHSVNHGRELDLELQPMSDQWASINSRFTDEQQTQTLVIGRLSSPLMELASSWLLSFQCRMSTIAGVVGINRYQDVCLFGPTANNEKMAI
jgi:hypothetical protein